MKPRTPLDWDLLRRDLDEVEQSVRFDDELRAAREQLLTTVKNNRRTPLLSRVTRRPAATGVRRPYAVLMGLAAAAALALGIASFRGALGGRGHAEPGFAVGNAQEHGVLGASVATQDSERPVHFSDGSVVTVGASSAVRVMEMTGDGANVELDEGSLHASVIHKSYTRWRVSAGPFVVNVTGTQFDLRWSPRSQTIHLDLREGSVLVTGPTLGPDGRRVVKGESLEVAVTAPSSQREGETATSPALAGIGPSGATANAGVANSGAANAGAANSGANSGAANAGAANAGATNSGAATGALGGRGAWKRFAQSHHYADALAAAETEGFHEICRQASANDLLLLADAARFAGAPRRADQALRSVRTTFAGTHAAAVAAFSLGRAAFDERRDFGQAAEWFQTYLHEEPGGALARESAGRLIEAYRGASNTAAARDAARSYLAQYPSGPHASLARSLTTP